jgi:hypothetical protein
MASERRSRRQNTGRQGQMAQEPQDPQELSLELIAQKLDQLTWRHSLMGVDEREVWHVIGRLDEMYRQLYREQEVRYEALLQEARQQHLTSSSTDDTKPLMARHPQRIRG